MYTLLDANAILRYLLNDVADQALLARHAIEQGSQTTIEVLAEVVYVLSGVYQVSRETIAQVLQTLLMSVEIDRRAEALDALEIFGTGNLDFVDCVIAARAVLAGQPVLTFDKKLLAALGLPS